jgi:hypothetical protein
LTRAQVRLLDQRTRGVIGQAEFERRARRSGIKNPERLLGEYQRGEIQWQLPVPLYVNVEYVRYYKYEDSDQPRYKWRHFEARGVFTVPSGVDPNKASILDYIAGLMDDAMNKLGIGIDEFPDRGWEPKEGGEPTGTTSSSFSSSVPIMINDVRRGYLYGSRASVEEDEFEE